MKSICAMIANVNEYLVKLIYDEKEGVRREEEEGGGESLERRQGV